jgi:hypothetical protein
MSSCRSAAWRLGFGDNGIGRSSDKDHLAWIKNRQYVVDLSKLEFEIYSKLCLAFQHEMDDADSARLGEFTHTAVAVEGYTCFGYFFWLYCDLWACGVRVKQWSALGVLELWRVGFGSWECSCRNRGHSRKLNTVHITSVSA